MTRKPAKRANQNQSTKDEPVRHIISAQRSESFEGPIPHPDHLARYAILCSKRTKALKSNSYIQKIEINHPIVIVRFHPVHIVSQLTHQFDFQTA